MILALSLAFAQEAPAATEAPAPTEASAPAEGPAPAAEAPAAEPAPESPAVFHTDDPPPLPEEIEMLDLATPRKALLLDLGMVAQTGNLDQLAYAAPLSVGGELWLPVKPRLSAVAGVERMVLGGQHARALEGDSTYVDYYGDVYGEDYAVAWSQVGLSGGVRLHPSRDRWGLPYVGAQAGVTMGTLRLDDDLYSEENTNQITRRAFVPSVELLAGGQLELWDEEQDPLFLPVVGVELGGFATLPQHYDEVGSLRVGGVHGRLVLGARF